MSLFNYKSKFWIIFIIFKNLIVMSNQKVSKISCACSNKFSKELSLQLELLTEFNEVVKSLSSRLLSSVKFATKTLKISF